MMERGSPVSKTEKCPKCGGPLETHRFGVGASAKLEARPWCPKCQKGLREIRAELRAKPSTGEAR